MNEPPAAEAAIEESNDMARNFKELQAKMDPASRADNKRRVREELQRMALEELRGARQLTQADMAEMLDVPQSSISRIERRADMYLSTLRNYIHAVGGELRIQAVFPDGGTVVIDRFGEYDWRAYEVEIVADGGAFRLHAFAPPKSVRFSTKPLKLSGLTKTLRALHVQEAQIANIKVNLEKNGGSVPIAGNGSGIQRMFKCSDLITAGFEETSAE